jgi:AraC-like DNA-binding protein
LVSEVMLASGQIDAPSALPVQAIGSAPVGEDLLGAVMRVARLAELPAEADFLLPPVMREIVYRLLMGEQGARLRHVAAAGGASHRIAEAIARLREEYDRPLRIGALARDLGMSVSAFHHHFKSVTAMSPLQFQKRLRLQEARRLMLGEGYDATTAGLSVGYDDASHFSREYKRLFGEPPMRDVARMRDAVMEPAAL